MAYIYVIREGLLEELVGAMSEADIIGIDTEADSLHHYFEKVCLIQVSANSKNYIVDPLSGIDLGEFLEVLGNKILIFHGGDYDLRMLRSSFGFKPNKEIFDTMLAAQLLGYDKFGLSDLVERFFNVILPKKGQKSDWSRRPLSKKLLKYASEDIEYLEELSVILREELERLGRLEWHGEHCARLVRSAVKERKVLATDKIWRVKGTDALDRRQLGFVRELWYWREEEAKRSDVPRFKIMSNELLLELAVWASGNEMVKLKKWERIPRSFKKKRVAEIEKVLEKALSFNESEWPDYRKSERYKKIGPEVKQLINALRDECARVAKGLGILPHVLASRASLTSIAVKGAKTNEEMMKYGRLMQWQAELLSPILKEVLS